MTSLDISGGVIPGIVNKIIAGSNISIDTGTGTVTITSTGGGGGTVTGSISPLSSKYLIKWNTDNTTVDVWSSNGTIINSGLNPTTEIQWALNNLTAGRNYREKILIQGNFTNLDQVTIPSYTVIELQGKVVAKGTIGSQKHLFKNADTLTGNTEIELYGGWWDANRDNNPASLPFNVIHFSNVTYGFVHHTHVIASMRTVGVGANQGAGTGIQLIMGSSFCVIDSNIVELNMKDGIQCDASTDNIIINNICRPDASVLTPVAIESAGIQLAYASDRNIVSNNQIYSNSLDHCYGIKLHGSSDNIISNNIMKDSKVLGLYMIIKDYQLNNNIILGNRIIDCSIGIEFFGTLSCTFTLIADNIISGSNYGIRITSTPSISDLFIVNNLLNSSTGYRAISSSPSLSNVKIAGNYISGYTTPIYNIEGTSIEIKRNFGYITESYGVSTIADGETISTDLHTLPVSVNLTPRTTIPVMYSWNTIGTSNSIKVYHSGTGSIAFSWEAYT